jgi:hypothetical protein
LQVGLTRWDREFENSPRADPGVISPMGS